MLFNTSLLADVIFNWKLPLDNAAAVGSAADGEFCVGILNIGVVPTPGLPFVKSKLSLFKNYWFVPNSTNVWILDVMFVPKSVTPSGLPRSRATPSLLNSTISEA